MSSLYLAPAGSLSAKPGVCVCRADIEIRVSIRSCYTTLSELKIRARSLVVSIGGLNVLCSLPTGQDHS
jgi:hypothetical protein